FADGAHARLRDGALRQLLGGRRVRLRPAVPVGLEAHGTGPRADRRQVRGRVASAAPPRAARRRAGVEHAELPLARARRDRRRGNQGADAGPQAPRRPVRRRGDRRGARAARRQERARRADCVFAGTRHGGGGMSALWGHMVGVLILVMMTTFIGIWVWAWLPRHRRVFDELAEIPMLDGEPASDGETLPRGEPTDDRGPAT